MKYECIDLEEQIERCWRLAEQVTDDEMRRSLKALARDYEVLLKLGRTDGAGFMLRE